MGKWTSGWKEKAAESAKKAAEKKKARDEKKAARKQKRRSLTGNATKEERAAHKQKATERKGKNIITKIDPETGKPGGMAAWGKYVASKAKKTPEQKAAARKEKKDARRSARTSRRPTSGHGGGRNS